MTEILGEHICLKNIPLKEYKKIYELRRNKNSNKYLNQISINELDQKKFIIMQKKLGNFFFGIYRKKNNKFLGTISVYNISKLGIAEWGRWLSNGTALENLESLYLLINFAIKKLLLKKLIAKTILKNTKVISLHQKLGFQSVQINKYDAFLRNVYYDTLVTSIKRSQLKKFNNIVKKFL